MDSNQHTGLRHAVSRRDALRAIGGAAGIGLAGCLSDVGAGSDTITIGLQADLTGTLASYGFWHRRTLEGYVEELNANDGIDGREVDLVVEDTATDSKEGQTAMRELVDRAGADFVIGSQDSGVSNACNPLAKQFSIPYFPLGEAPSITGEDGNRWVIRNNHDVTQAAQIAVRYGLENLGSKWTIVYQDYDFGQQYRDTISEGVEAGDGEILRSIPVEVGAGDLTPNLNRVPDDTEVLFNALVGASTLSFLDQSADLGVPGARLGPIASVEGVDVSGLAEGAQDAAYVTPMPRELDQYDTEENRHLREIAGVDDADEVLNGGHYWASYEAISWIKDAVEESDWSSADDNRDFVRWFEAGPERDAGAAYPQGDTFFRGTDHQAFVNMFIERIEGDRLTVEEEIPVDEPTFPPAANLADQSF